MSAATHHEPGSPIEPPAEGPADPPQHGFAGTRRPAKPSWRPTGVTVAVSREAGARGGSIAKRVGRALDWPVYQQDSLDYLVQESAVRSGVLEDLAPAAAEWVEGQLEMLLRTQSLSQHPSVVGLARVVLSLGSRGDVVLIGRGAGFILPRETTLNVRIVAPEPDRVAYLGQWSRLTLEQAAEQVRLRDTNRAAFLSTHFHRQAADVHQYDLLLNSSLLGEEMCADLIARAVRARHAALDRGA